jgi:hypothetical protein
VPIVLKSGSLNLLEPSGPVQAYNGIDLPLPLPFTNTLEDCLETRSWRVKFLSEKIFKHNVRNEEKLLTVREISYLK